VPVREVSMVRGYPTAVPRPARVLHVYRAQ
jgi:hypothetical protein